MSHCLTGGRAEYLIVDRDGPGWASIVADTTDRNDRNDRLQGHRKQSIGCQLSVDDIGPVLALKQNNP